MATIVVGVTGGVAAFKAPIVVRECQRAGHDVYVTATRASLDFVGRSTWEGITSRPVAVDIAGEGRAEHVELARIADLIIVVPATANSLARLAAGFADDMVSLTVLASDAPVVVAPAMHSNMWLSPATQANVKTLRERGVHVIDPTSGALGSGDSGVGRLPEPEEIARVALNVLEARNRASSALAGRTVVVTTGGTREPIDPVRFLGNRSSGRQGLAIASAAARAGASVRVIAANIESALLDELPTGVQITCVGSALQMREATIEQVADADALVMTAAVADFRPGATSESKMKKDPSTKDAPMIRLVRNPDILAEIGHSDQRPPLVVGFAAETGTDEEILAYGTDKAARKGADFICLNRVGENVGFGDVPNDIRL
ncbi:MAG: bifunctional phosphopantothenoylcysteine decarboxylase/phosphopantothenate--cysteine ligase CoaBC, partial [Actinomyces sp.]|nr:bifunctional phosphopantothenoylcysteine decarboxylase/phosphopantothenate--cysteine ligase CoaBC [Actinomyces sp.]